MTENTSDSSTPTGSLDGATAGSDVTLRPRSRWWWLGSIGITGVLLYFALRYDDLHRAKQCLWIGIVSFAVYPGSILIVVVLGLLGTFDPPY